MKILGIFRNSQILNLIIVSVMVVVLVVALVGFGDSSKDLGLETLENTIEQYATACYATEGSYPADLEYLEAHYGLILDYETYIYQYEVFGSNILPDISVLERP